MVAMTRRLHMGCGEALQSHLSGNLRVTEPKPELKLFKTDTKQIRSTRKETFRK